MVSGHMWSELPQIGEGWVQGRLVVGMGHTSECGVVVASVGSPPWPILSGGSQAMGDGRLVVSGQMWSQLPQIGGGWLQGRLVAGMGHTS